MSNLLHAGEYYYTVGYTDTLYTIIILVLLHWKIKEIIIRWVWFLYHPFFLYYTALSTQEILVWQWFAELNPI